ncbi:MAG: hypothetical protein ACRCYY_13380 [Trueperaceae bacterium]
MKVLFYIQRLEDAHMAHALAYRLRNDLPITDIAAITFRQAPEALYLRQKAADVFSAVLSETEMHRGAEHTRLRPDFLSTVETNYGLPFWQYVTQNRFLIMKRANYLHEYGTLYEREQLVAHVQSRFDMTERFVDTFKPNLVIFPVDVGPSSALILDRVAKHRGIPVFVPISSKIGSYHTLIDTVFSETKAIEQRFHVLQRGGQSPELGKARDIITTFRQGSLTPSYMQGVTTDNFEDKLPVKSAFKKTQDIVRKRFGRAAFQKKHGEVFNLSQFEYDIDRAAGYYRRWRLRYGDYFENMVRGEKFIFFPLHVEPELALLLYAPFRTHQSSIIQNIAQSLTWDTSLYVKEHPQAIGVKAMGFYNRVHLTANVRMIYPHVSSRNLITHSQGVVTITGTAGMEALLLNKPTVTLGNVFYNFVPNLVTRAKSIEDLPKLIRNFDNFIPDESSVENFVAALLEASVPIDPEGLAARLTPLSLEEKLEHPELKTYSDFLFQNIVARLRARQEAKS